MRKLKRFFVTGGAGFIGSSFIRFLLARDDVERVINFDLLTYAGTLKNVEGCERDPRYRFIHGDILNQSFVEELLKEEKIDTLVHFAAESHVDRSIACARPFVEVNVLGTLSLLEAVKKNSSIHFHQISTDEVFGALGEEGFFSETSPYQPNSPYSASKAGADHLVRAFTHTYNLSTTISHSSNNYGPGQHTEKLIPLVISNCLQNLPLPIYGQGRNVRDWLYVEDHAEAIFLILQKGRRGESYNVGGNSQLPNIELIHLLIELLAEAKGVSKTSYQGLIRFVEDRPGHDFRYAVDTSKIENELGWKVKTSLSKGIA